MSTDIKITGLAKRLVSDNLLNAAVAEKAHSQARQDRMPFVRHLVKHKMLASLTIAQVASREFGLPLLSLDAIDLAHIPLHLVDTRLIRKHHVLPLRQLGNCLCLAVSDPSDVNAINEIKFHTGINTELIVVEDDKLNQAIEDIVASSEAEEANFGDLDGLGLEDIDIEVVDEESDEHPDDNIDETPIVRFVNKILLDAIKTGSSDIHIEPYEKIYRVRFRQDGILREITRPPLSIANRISSRIKIMSQMDISERRIPQDGRIKMKLSKTRAIDFRVNTLPTLWGEKIVMRILDPGSAQMGIEALGYEQEQKQYYLNALNQHQGMILVTGPTGSGKTVSLYTGLNILNTLERNISTAEDPVEINLEGVNQVAVNVRVGLDFATALRAFLRQDPDVVMVGEIRDLETAEIAIKAAQTGHLVLSTLHTNSAPETLTRLRNMGIPAYNVATSVTLIIAQRLARRLCSHCKKPLRLPPKVLLQEGFSKAQLEDLQLYGAVGCDKCNKGYKGRVGIYQVMPITDSIARVIMNDGNSIQIADKAREEGFNDLRTSALRKVAEGVTSLAEANRVT
ncbi:MAG: type IV-A pilus assembly ATPase PilB [Pseudomonadales bacterium]|nr:type IV-A pilus assembly ATPase PilB [Pseudomonadales bacterium]